MSVLNFSTTFLKRRKSITFTFLRVKARRIRHGNRVPSQWDTDSCYRSGGKRVADSPRSNVRARQTRIFQNLVVVLPLSCLALVVSSFFFVLLQILLSLSICLFALLPESLRRNV